MQTIVINIWYISDYFDDPISPVRIEFFKSDSTDNSLL